MKKTCIREISFASTTKFGHAFKIEVFRIDAHKAGPLGVHICSNCELSCQENRLESGEKTQILFGIERIDAADRDLERWTSLREIFDPDLTCPRGEFADGIRLRAFLRSRAVAEGGQSA